MFIIYGTDQRSPLAPCLGGIVETLLCSKLSLPFLSSVCPDVYNVLL